MEFKDNQTIVAAGEIWDVLVAHAVQKNLWGIENLSGVPARWAARLSKILRLRAALSQVIQCVEVFDQKTGRSKLVAQRARIWIQSKYFQGMRTLCRIACRAQTFNFNPYQISHTKSAARFQDKMPTLEEIREAVLQIRKNKFPDLSVEGLLARF